MRNKSEDSGSWGGEGISEAIADDKAEVLVLDPDAAAETGHHADWYRRLSQALDALGILHARATPRKATSFSAEAWYRDAIREACSGPIPQVLFTAGDAALVPALRQFRRIRRCGKVLHLFLFRMERQPRSLGRMTLLAKVVALVLLRLLVRDVNAYVLQLPIGNRPAWHRFLGLIPVLDSSGIETARPVGRAEARRMYDHLVPDNHKVILVIGMLGPGKHVDTLVDAWNRRPPSDASLIFAGEATPEIDALLAISTRRAETICYLPGRVRDEEFDRLIEGADVVAAVYRYSASSGVVLRALTLGTKVLVGGSAVLERQLRGVDGVILVSDIQSAAIVTAVDEALKLPDPAPMERHTGVASVFPAPIVTGIDRYRDRA